MKGENKMLLIQSFPQVIIQDRIKKPLSPRQAQYADNLYRLAQEQAPPVAAQAGSGL